jgi:hypothetical protein
MARKKDLGGLAALAGLAYMASRDKEGKGSTPSAPTGDDQYNPDVKQRGATAPDLGEIRDEEGTLSKLRRNTETGEAYDPTGSSSSMASAPASKPAATRSIAAKAPSNPNYGNEGRRPVKEASSKPAYETPYDRARREDREAGRDIGSVVEGLKNRIATAGERGSALPLKSTKSDKNDFMGSGMKKGGSVKGWGIARGARKAKTY